METHKKIFAIDIRLIGKKRTGDETVFFNLTKQLVHRDRKNRYFLVTDTKDIKKVSEIREKLECARFDNVEIVSLGGSNRFVWNFFTLPFFLIRQKVDIYHTQYILPFFVPKRTRVVEHIHDVSFCAYPQLIGWTDRFFLWLLMRFSLRRAACIIAPSLFTKGEIIKYYQVAPEKISVIPNAVSDDFCVVVEDAEVARVREKYALPENFILYVGTFQPRKNISFLIEAYATLSERLPQTRLVLVGSKTAYHTDVHINAALKRIPYERSVIFPGFVEQKDLPAVIRAAHTFAFPSLYEGFGIPLLEAMSQGVPVAASNIQSLQEVAGDAALYFDPVSVAECAEMLYTLSVDEERRGVLLEKGKERFQTFSWNKSAAKLLSVYERIAE